MANGLTRRQRVFVQQYLIDLNATQAAIRSGYSPKGATVTASKLLANSKVAESVQKSQDSLAKATGLTQEKILHELAILGNSDPRHYRVDENGELALAPGAPDDAWRAVSQVKRRKHVDKYGGVTYEIEFKLWDKPGSIKMVGQHLGTFTERVDITSKGEKLEGPKTVQVVNFFGKDIQFP